MRKTSQIRVSIIPHFLIFFSNFRSNSFCENLSCLSLCYCLGIFLCRYYVPNFIKQQNVYQFQFKIWRFKKTLRFYKLILLLYLIKLITLYYVVYLVIVCQHKQKYVFLNYDIFVKKTHFDIRYFWLNYLKLWNFAQYTYLARSKKKMKTWELLVQLMQRIGTTRDSFNLKVLIISLIA